MRANLRPIRSSPIRFAAAMVGLIGVLAASATGAAGSSAMQADTPVSSAPETTTGAAEIAATVLTDLSPPSSDDTAFPVTIPHAFGETTVNSAPARVVSIGFSDHDVLLALGVEPVAIRQWYGDYEYVWPWAQGALGDLQPALLPSSDLNFEEIAALQPDLIIGQYIGLEEQEYGTLSQIAPTIAQPADFPAFGAPWQVITHNIGAAVGQSAQAEALVTDVESLFDEARSAHPEFAGVGLAYAGVYGTDTANYYVETDGSTRMRVLQDLGFVVPDALAALGSDAFYHDISAEQISLLDQDVALWEPAVLELLPAVQDNPLYQTLAVSIEDRDVFLTDPLVAGAMAHSTVLSLPVVLEFLIPELSRAVANLER